MYFQLMPQIKMKRPAGWLRINTEQEVYFGGKDPLSYFGIEHGTMEAPAGVGGRWVEEDFSNH